MTVTDDSAAPAAETIFISRSGADADFAAEVARILEANGYSVVLQQWDFANRNFMERMHTTLAEGARVVALLSPEYLRSEHCQAEWQNAIAQDPLNKQGRLVLLRVAECEPPGLLSGLAYWDLVPVRDDRPLLQELVQSAVRNDHRDDGGSGTYWRAPRSIVDAEAIRPTPGFTGREKELSAIADALDSHEVAVVNGLGGMGKSSTAREYAWRNRDRYSVVWWLNAQTEDGLIDGLLRLGALFVRGLDQLADRRSAAQQVITAVLNGFAKPVLLVFDNLEDEQLLHAWRPRVGSKVLITSRDSAWGSDIAPIGLNVWSRENAVEYLRRESTRADFSEEDAHALVDALGELPLALAHAAAYLRATRTATPARYLSHLAEHMTRTPRNANYPRSVFATFQAAIAIAEEQAPGAASVMCFAARFAPDQIPDELLRQDPELYAAELRPVIDGRSEPVDLGSAVEDELSLDDALGALDRLSLLWFSPSSNSYSVHRLVQLAARDLVGLGAGRWGECAVRVASAAFPEESFEFATWPHCERLITHAREALAGLDGDNISTEAARLMSACGVYLMHRASFEEAELLLLTSLASKESAFGPDHPDVGLTLTYIASLRAFEGQYDEAIRCESRALSIREAAFGPNHTIVADSLNNLSIIHFYRGDVGESESLQLRALRIREAQGGPDHPDTAESMSNLAMIYVQTERFTEAEALARRSLSIRERALGPGHPAVAYSLNYIATSLQKQGRLEEAASFSERCVAVLENAYPETHPHIGTMIVIRARILSELGRLAEAETLARRALSTHEKSLPPEHPNIAADLHVIALLCEQQQHYVDAEDLEMRALAIREKALSADHYDLARSLYALATIYRAQGRNDEAVPLLERAVTIFDNALGEMHRETQAAREALSNGEG